MPPLPPFSLPASARQFAGVSAGIFVGVRDFEDPELPQVRFAVDDAVDLAHLFALELGLIDPRKTVLLLAGEPQKDESRRRLAGLLEAGGVREHPWAYAVYHHLHRLGQQTEPEGLLVASFATHGLSDQGKAILAVAGALRRRLVHTGLPIEVLLDDLGLARAQRRVLLLDACRERLGDGTRALGDVEPFGDTFVAAMQQARGCAILAGASQGGFAYDDTARGNGVFSGALIDGLLGEAEGNAEALVTIESLASFAHGRVRDWVLKNKPRHAEVSLGISATYDPDDMRGLPLAIDGRRQRARFERQVNEALAHLVGLVGPRDPLYRDVVSALEVERPAPEHFELLKEVAEFDGSPRHRRSLAAFLEEMTPAAAPPPEPPKPPEPPEPLPPPKPPAVAPQAPRPLAAAAARSAPQPDETEIWDRVAAQQKAYEVQTFGRVITGRNTATDGHGQERPFWAAADGVDEFGRWAELRFEKAAQRLRWIPPGEFLMGSPENEAGRFAFEGPRHRVRLGKGFWLADTPCTQAMFQALVKRNPSQFRSLRRPVENVSWHSAQEFLKQLEKSFAGIEARLPTEAEWEYACRAGSLAATYAGDLEILGKRNAPLLDAIAWYGGNSGEGFDLKEGVDSRSWTEKQYPHRKAGSREVAGKAPNTWGLYDMLGNVWEWCRDAASARNAPYSGEAQADPFSQRGDFRIYRGGSWLGYAGRVRAACRAMAEPGYKSPDLGFRIAIG